MFVVVYGLFEMMLECVLWMLKEESVVGVRLFIEKMNIES